MPVGLVVWRPCAWIPHIGNRSVGDKLPKVRVLLRVSASFIDLSLIISEPVCRPGDSLQVLAMVLLEETSTRRRPSEPGRERRLALVVVRPTTLRRVLEGRLTRFPFSERVSRFLAYGFRWRGVGVWRWTSLRRAAPLLSTASKSDHDASGPIRDTHGPIP